MKLRAFAAAAALLSFASVSHADCPSAYDDSFGEDGIVLQDYPENVYAGPSSDIAIAHDGSIYVLADVRAGEMLQRQLVVLRYEPDGDLDESFGDGGMAFIDTPAFAVAIALQGDGKVIVNYGKLVPPETDSFSPGVVRLLEDGEIDASFGDGGFVVLDRGRKTYSRDVIVRSDDVIVVVGQERDTPYSWQAFAYFLDEDGDLVDTEHILPDQSAVATGVVELDDHAIAVGGTTLGDFSSGTFVAKLDAGGEPVDAFGVGGARLFAPAGVNEETWRVERDADGRIYTAGNAAPSYFGQRTRIVVHRLLPDGRPDRSFGTRGRSIIRFQRRVYPRGLAVTADGQAVVASTWRKGALLARFTEDGRRDRSFGDYGLFRGSGTSFEKVAIQDDGGIVANSFDGASARQMLVRLVGGTWDGVEACVVGCGDGVKQPREQCEDGNTTNGDGCSAACLLE